VGTGDYTKELGITYSRPYFINPYNDEKIFVLADVPHLLKLIRNHYVNQSFIINGKKIKKKHCRSCFGCNICI
jgi:hypothetical protein